MNRATGAVAAVLLAASLAACTSLGSGADTPTDVAVQQSSATHHHKPAAHKPHHSKPKPHYSLSQQQAIGSAKDYLSLEAFSKKGLIRQLSSKAGEGFGRKLAVVAVNHIKVNWKAEAVKSARDYLKMEHFSRAGLIQQLHSPAGEQFTLAQATYAANHVGLH